MSRRIHSALVSAVLALSVSGRAWAQSPTTPVTDAPGSPVAPRSPVATFGMPQVADPAPEPIPAPLEMPPPPTTNSRRIPLGVFWDDGLRFESESQQFRLHVGGSAQIDSTWLIGPQSVFALPDGSANGIGNASATFLRRTRLRADGELFDLFDFVVEYDFANASNENSGDQPPSFS